MYGAYSIRESQAVIRKIIETLRKRKLPVIKWASKCPEARNNIDESFPISAYVEADKAVRDIKNLGLHYSTRDDCLLYIIEPNLNVVYTNRRGFLIATFVFDPIGWLLAVVTKLQNRNSAILAKSYDCMTLFKTRPEVN